MPVAYQPHDQVVFYLGYCHAPQQGQSSRESTRSERRPIPNWHAVAQAYTVWESGNREIARQESDGLVTIRIMGYPRDISDELAAALFGSEVVERGKVPYRSGRGRRMFDAYVQLTLKSGRRARNMVNIW